MSGTKILRGEVFFCGKIAQRVDVWYAISILSQQKSPIGKAKNDPCPMLQWEAGASCSTPAILTRPPCTWGWQSHSTMTNLKNLLGYLWCHMQCRERIRALQYRPRVPGTLENPYCRAAFFIVSPFNFYSLPININGILFITNRESHPDNRPGYSWGVITYQLMCGRVICYISDQFAILDSFSLPMSLAETS